MSDPSREIKSRLRTDWGPVLWFVRIYFPLALTAALIAIFWINAPVEWALAGFVLFSLLGLLSMTLTARRHARQIAEKLETVSDVVWKMSAGQFDERVPPGSREQIEELAATIDRAQSSLKTRVSDLESSRNQLRTVLNSMVEGVIAVDGEQRVLLVNEAACRLFPSRNHRPWGARSGS